MSKRKKRCIILGLVGLCLLLLGIVLPQFIAVSVTTEAGGCFAVVFDKNAVTNADRIVLREGNKKITITDQDLVREISSEFVVANKANLCGYTADRWMEIYNGDKLVRNIQWNDHGNLVMIYETDIAHWVWPGSDQGQVELSDELVQTLNAIMQGNGEFSPLENPI